MDVSEAPPDPEHPLLRRWSELRRNPVVQIVAIYVAASWFVVQAAAIFLPTLGLPRSSLLWLGTVLLVGLAGVAALAVRHHRDGGKPAGEAADAGDVDAGGEPPAEPPSGPSRRGRWALAAVGALVAIGVVLWAIRPRLLQGSVTDSARTMAVVPFSASGAQEDVLGEGIVDLLSTNLDGVGDIRVVDPRSVLQRWRAAGEDGGVDLQEILGIGRDLGAGSVLTGSVVQAGGGLRLDARLYSVDGEELARARTEGPADRALALVDSLSLQVVREVWRSWDPVPNLRIAAVTTSSVEAMRHFLRGMRAYRRSDWDGAADGFRRAVDADSTFALAHSYLANAYGWLSDREGSERAAEHVSAAARHAGQLPERERTLVTARRLFREADPAALDTLQRFVDRYPRAVEGWYRLGEVRFHQAWVHEAYPPEQLYAPFERAAELDPSFTPPLQHLVDLAVRWRDTSRLRRYLGWMEERADPENAVHADLAGRLALGATPVDSVEPDSLLRLAVERQSLWSALRWSPVVDTVGIGPGPDLSLSLLRALGKAPDDALRASGPEPDELRLAEAFWLLGLGRTDSARSLLEPLLQADDDALAIAALSGHLAPDLSDRARRILEQPAQDAFGPYRSLVLAISALQVGRLGDARRFLATARSDSVELTPAGRGLVETIGGGLRLARGDTASGLAALEEGLDRAGSRLSQISAPLRYRRAAALAARDATREEGIRRLRYGFGANLDILYLPVAWERAARALEAAGRPGEAARAHRHFARLWSGADSVFRPRVERAREAASSLEAAERAGPAGAGG